MKFAGVIVDISHEQLDKIFQYIIPETMLPELEIGMKVQIPFGKTKRTGYVVDISDEPEIDISRMKSLTGICGHSVTIDGRMIKLANWIKNHYGSTMSQKYREKDNTSSYFKRRSRRICKRRSKKKIYCKGETFRNTCKDARC